ncbi:MAG: hypothetical protein AAF587_41420 [Bacteroidota bacterium]
MKKLSYLSLLSFVLLFHPTPVSAQDFMAQLGAVAVDMEIQSGGRIIHHGPTYIVKRATELTHFMFESAYAVESYHLEFKTNTPIPTTELKGKSIRKFHYIVQFFHANGSLLHTSRLARNMMKRASWPDSEAGKQAKKHYYSLNLLEFPLLLLEDVKTVDIQYVGRN